MGKPAESGQSGYVPLAGPSQPSAEALAELITAFEESLGVRPDLLRTADYSVGGRVLRTRVLGVGLATVLARALLPAEGTAPPALTLDLWDCWESGQAAPARATGDEVVVRCSSNGERFAVTRDQRYASYSGPGFVLRHDRIEQRAAGWAISHARLSPSNVMRPWQRLIVPWLVRTGSWPMHAALVARDGRGVLLAGQSGTGKSTISGACIEAGFEFLGDDVISVDDDLGDALHGHCLYPVLKLNRAQARAFPSLVSGACNNDDPYGDEIFFSVPGASRATTRIVALALPCLSPQADSRFTLVRPIEALRALTQSLLWLEDGRIESDFEFLCGVVDSIRAFRFEVGTDPSSIAPALASLLEDAGE